LLGISWSRRKEGKRDFGEEKCHESQSPHKPLEKKRDGVESRRERKARWAVLPVGASRRVPEDDWAMNGGLLSRSQKNMTLAGAKRVRGKNAMNKKKK